MTFLSSNLPEKRNEMPVSPTATLNQVDGIPPLRHYFNIIKRWRLVIAVSLVGFIVLGLIVTLLMTPKYTATSTIEISRESDRVTNFQGVERDVSIADQEFYQTQYGLLSSKSLSEKVASDLRLVNEPSFFAMFKGPYRDPAFSQTDGRYAPSGRSTRLRVAGEILRKHISINPARLSRLVDINFTSPDAAFSAKVANAWAKDFIESNLERKVQATAYGRDVIQKQLADYKARLDDSQRRLVDYASREQIINLPAQGPGSSDGGGRSVISDKLGALNNALSQAIADRIDSEAKYRQAGATGASQEALRNPAINNLREKRAELSAEYDRLMVQFEPSYPPALQIQSQLDQLDRSIAREERRVLSSYRADYRQSLQRENELRQQVSSLKSDYLDLRRRSIQYNIYQQEVDTNRALYDGLLQRFKEIGVAAGVGVNNVAVVDSAFAPRKPSSPHILLNLLAAAILGSFVGIATALGLEQLDDAVEDPADVQRRLGLPLLGTVPKLIDMTPIDALADRKSDLVDAYFAVQTNLSFSTESGIPKSFSVTSTRPTEGKSTTSLALAATLARSGKRVILVDGDMRSPSVHHLGGVTHERGLSNFLTGEDSFNDLTFAMPQLNFDAISAGPLPPNAAELLTGPRLSVLIQRLLNEYDHVVIDSPPVLGLADAPLIANSVDGVIYCVESHKIRSSIAKASMNRLTATGARIFGCVLTKFEPKKAHHGYGYEYGYSYGKEFNVAEPLS